MHQIRFRLGLRPRPRSGSLQRSQRPLAGFKGPKGREERRKGKGKNGCQRKGEGKGGKRNLPPLKFRSGYATALDPRVLFGTRLVFETRLLLEKIGRPKQINKHLRSYIVWPMYQLLTFPVILIVSFCGFVVIIIQLVVDYVFDAPLRSLFDHYDFYVMPCINPDGYQYSHTDVRHLTTHLLGLISYLTLYCKRWRPISCWFSCV